MSFESNILNLEILLDIHTEFPGRLRTPNTTVTDNYKIAPFHIPTKEPHWT